MKILILNWRDIKNPYSGGAEILTHEIAKYLVKKNNEVTIFSSVFPGAQKEETIDGVKIIRKGESIARYFLNSVHFLAFREYNNHFKGNIDLVIDEVHGLPFFTPWYVSEKKITLICEVAGSLWIKMFGLILGTIGRIVEIFYLRFVYKNIPFITISNSAKEDLIRNGVDKNNITIIPVGVHTPKEKPRIKREDVPTLIFLGRITKSKGVEDSLLALKDLINKTEVRLWIVGKEDTGYIRYLKEYAKKLQIDRYITFYGFVTDEEKFNLLSRAWLLIHPSKTEGWGINVIEGNIMGVPAIGYNVPGLKDSIQHGKTGLLAIESTPNGLAQAIEGLLLNKKLYSQLSANAIRWSKRFEWETVGEQTWQIIKKLYEGKN